MAEKKFAFESEEVSIATYLYAGLGDAVIAKKVFDAIVELAPNCLIDIFYLKENHRAFANAFFRQSKNFNLTADYQKFYPTLVKKYDLAIYLHGSHAVLLDWANVQRLKTAAPALWQAVIKIDEYNKQNFYKVGSSMVVNLRNIVMAQVLHRNCYYFLSCGGALPIRDDKVNIPLASEVKPQFNALKLDKYITIYTDIGEYEKERPKVKAWPMRCLREYVARMKKRLPQIEIVQCGGNDDVKIENVDRCFLGADLELTKYILANSLLHVGCEGGLIHLATALETKCLVLFGYTDVN
ncbi:MAG: hypothetical protein IKI08_05640 [Selenomonadaceae bacterium]|nr:hypothetical protein [Selenomonadaceae bacterium]